MDTYDLVKTQNKFNAKCLNGRLVPYDPSDETQRKYFLKHGKIFDCSNSSGKKKERKTRFRKYNPDIEHFNFNNDINEYCDYLNSDYDNSDIITITSYMVNRWYFHIDNYSKVIFKLGKNHDKTVTKIPKLSEGLQILECANNYITDIFMPGSVRFADCSRNCITSLQKELPRNLTEFYCYKNRIVAELEYLPDSMEVFDCEYNRITRVPTVIPPRMKKFNCNYNEITETPTDMPDTMIFLSITGNKITELISQLPPNLAEFHCNCNPIKHISPANFEIMKMIYINSSFNKTSISIHSTNFYDIQGYSSIAEFFKIKEDE
jgi:Leucine-rich repeat (LRR) protein